MPRTIGGHPILAPNGLINTVRNVPGQVVSNIGTQYSKNTDEDTGPPKSLSPGIDYAQRLARDRGDVSTAASTIGVNARKAAKIKKLRGK